MATKKTETKVDETKKELTFDQQLLEDIKFNKDAIAKKYAEINQHKGALNYAQYAYQIYMETLEDKEPKDDSNKD